MTLDNTQAPNYEGSQASGAKGKPKPTELNTNDTSSEGETDDDKNNKEDQ